MQSDTLKLFAEELSASQGAPLVLDVEHSVQVHRPTLTGSISPTSYYIRPPQGTSAEELIKQFEATPGFERMNLTLTSILGIDTYHQPLISADDFAKKHFSDNLQRIVRVVGKSDPAIEGMAAFVEGLKRPFSADTFPHHDDFIVSGYRVAAGGKSAEVKLLFKPADPTLLMKVERLVKLHLAEANLGREIRASRHYTREQPPELILSSTSEMQKGHAFLEALVNSLPRATQEQVAEISFAAEQTPTPPMQQAAPSRVPFPKAQEVSHSLAPAELKNRVTKLLAEILRSSGFGGGAEVRVVQNGTAVEVDFPRSAKTLWLGSSFDEKKEINSVKAAVIGVKADPVLRDGWDLHYRFDSKTGKFQLRVVNPGTPALSGAKAV